ncbi:hypothetical protein B0H11DRAFT_2284954 [Mycena galericulata]|nr:hypothetical protein B0H11DRAFT_2284954 [Mycena galericulata]
MASALRIRFEGLDRDFTAKKWRIPDHTGSFHSIPGDVTSLFVPRTGCLFLNRQGDRRRQEVGLDYAKLWGLNDEEDAEVIFARASRKFCLRLVFNAKRSTQDIRSNSFQAYARLVKDARFHSTHLRRIEGSIVPVHYGMWLMDTGDWAGKVLISITQYCGISWNELRHTKMNTQANRLLVGRTFETLHDSGVDHGGKPSVADLRHVIIDLYAPGLSRTDMLEGKAPCYIVSFSEAHANHQCGRRLPIVPLDAFPYPREVGCEETTSVLFLLNFMQRPNETPTPVSDALKWHAQYSKLYPDIKNAHILIAQRERLYKEFPPVYPTVYVDFQSDDLYCKADLTREPTDSEKKAEEAAGSRAESVIGETVPEAMVHNLQLTELRDPPAVVAF